LKIKSISIALLVCLCCSPSQADIEGRVVAVTDGDTIKVLDSAKTQHKVRLTGIDAPEKSQPFGNKSKEYLAALVAGKDVFIESDKNDRYGRVLGKVWVQPIDCSSCGKTLDANHAQLVAGMAWWYRYYAKQQSPKDRALYELAEDKAKPMKLGLWVGVNPVPPWDYRRGKKDKASVIAMPENCGQKRYCKEMGSCEEAKFYLSKCGLTSLDGNNDGVPCNSLCR
jgi:endonuclease YncB( thermonuclease family)